jgi:phage tail-like protein
MEGQGTSRRRFLGTAAGATGVALGAAVWGAGTAAAAVAGTDGPKALMADKRSYVSGRFALDLGGTKAGWLQDVEGGHATADVVNEKQGTDGIVHKHIAGVKYEDISLQIGFSMSKAIYDWISASWRMNYQRKNGSIVAADFDLDAKAGASSSTH